MGRGIPTATGMFKALVLASCCGACTSLDTGTTSQDFRVMPFAASPVDGYLGTGLMSSHRICLDIKQEKGAIP